MKHGGGGEDRKVHYTMKNEMGRKNNEMVVRETMKRNENEDTNSKR